METRKNVILITEPTDYSAAALAVYRSFGTVVLGSADYETLMQQLSSATIAVVRLRIQFDAAMLKTYGAKLTCIVSPTTGINHIDTAFAQSKNIQIISLQGEVDFLESIPSTAEFTWGLILAVSRNIITAAMHTIKGHWDRDLFKGHNIKGKTIGIIGLGRVGKQVAHFAQAFDMQVAAFDIEEKLDYPNYISMKSTVHELVAQSDFISIHIPSAGNNHFINSEILELCKSGAVMINTSRANIWDEVAIVTAINNGKLGAVATDVLSHENSSQNIGSNPLWIAAQNSNRIILTPHLAGATYESMESTELFMAEKCKNAMQ